MRLKHEPDLLRMFEKSIIVILLVLMMLMIVATVVELATTLFRQLIHPPVFSLNTRQAIEIFGIFLTVLIGLELLESTKIYLEENRMHAEVVFLVAIIAVSRKVITLDYVKTRPETLYGISAIILALTIGYFLVRRALEEAKPGANRHSTMKWRKPSWRTRKSSF